MARLLIIVLVILVSFSSASALDKSIILYLPLDEESGKVAKDISIHKNNGEILGNAEWEEEGKIGGCLNLTGGSYVEMQEIPAYDVTEEITLMAWINTSTPGRLIDKSETKFSGFVMMVNNELTLRIECGVRGTFPGINSTSQVGDGEWHFVVATFGKDKDKDGKETGFRSLKVYVDGEMEGESISATDINPNDWPLMIGVRADTKESPYTGLIDEVVVFNRELSEDEILDIFENGITLSVDSRGKLAVLWGDLRK